MSATFSVTMIDANGNAQTGLDVDLYTGDGGDGSSKVGDFTDNGDGTYKITVSSSGKYTVKVGGVIQTEMQNIYIVVDDVLKSSNVVNDLTTGGTTVPLSAEMGKTLQTTKVNVSDIVDNLTSGGTTVPLSAEMGKTLNTTKADSSVIGNRTYTYQHVVTNSQTITNSIDALDAAIGNLDFSDDPILKSFIQMATSNPSYKNLTNALKVLSRFAMTNRNMITNGTAIYNRRSLFVEETVAAIGAGEVADEFPVYSESASSYKLKRRATYRKYDGDNHLELTGLLYHIPPGSSPTDTACLSLALYYDGILVTSAETLSSVTDEVERQNKEFSLSLGVAALENKNYEVRVYLKLLTGASDTLAALTELNLDVLGA